MPLTPVPEAQHRRRRSDRVRLDTVARRRLPTQRFHRLLIVEQQVRAVPPDAKSFQGPVVAGLGQSVDGSQVFLPPDLCNACFAQRLDQLARAPASSPFHAAFMERCQRTVQRVLAAGFGSQAGVDAQKEGRTGPVNPLLRLLMPHVRAQAAQCSAATVAVVFSTPEPGQQFLPGLALGDDACPGLEQVLVVGCKSFGKPDVVVAGERNEQVSEFVIAAPVAVQFVEAGIGRNVKAKLRGMAATDLAESNRA